MTISADDFKDNFISQLSFPIEGGSTPYKRGPYLPGENIPEETEPFVPIELAGSYGQPSGMSDSTYEAIQSQYGNKKFGDYTTDKMRKVIDWYKTGGFQGV